MVWNSIKSIKTKGHDCFLSENGYQGFEEIKPINILIGKNNSGKSKLLNFVKNLVELNANTNILNLTSGGQLDYVLNTSLQPMFNPGLSGWYLADANGRKDPFSVEKFFQFSLLGKIISFKDGDISIQGNNFSDGIDSVRHQYKIFCDDLKNYISIFSEYRFIEIKAERDIEPESTDNGEFNFLGIYPSGSMLAKNGKGFSKLITKCLITKEAWSKKYDQYVEETFLGHVNSVLFPETKFTRINSKLIDAHSYEVYLEEHEKGQISLSNCGSGVKTVLLVMALLHLIPKLSGHKKFVIALEELENNLHPALERRLLAHVRDHVRKNPEILLFLTTHSSVAIDLFGKDEDAQITRIWNDGKASFCERVDTWNHKSNLLDDLGVKASDLLQANCIVWLEGPSDRVYFDKWVEVFSDGKIERGVHYECAFYGGSNLAHHCLLDDGDETDINDFIEMLKVNRNSLVLMDSDKKAEAGNLKARVTKIVEEAKIASKDRILAWVTAGKEIENYIPVQAVQEYFGADIELEQYGSISELYTQYKKSDFSSKKVTFAKEIIELNGFSKTNLEQCLDLAEKMKVVIDRITYANS